MGQMKWIRPFFRVTLPLRNSAVSFNYDNPTFIVVNVCHDSYHASDWLNEFSPRPFQRSFRRLFCYNLEMNKRRLNMRT